MDIGVIMFNGYPMNPARLGAAVEERGFESLFYPEHTHIPVGSTRTDGRPAEEYARTYDPFVALAAAAAVTQKLKLGTAVSLIAQRDPIITAKEVASIDLLSDGRFLFGVGAGWNRQEMVNHGVDPRTRMALMAEQVQAMRVIWTHDQAEYHGDHVDFAPIWSWPKPAQPHVPVLVGGNGPGSEDRVLRFGDGWMPQCGPLESVEELRDRIVALRRRAAEDGHALIPVTLFGVPYDRALIDQFATAGVDRCLLPVREADESAMLSRLDDLAALVS